MSFSAMKARMSRADTVQEVIKNVKQRAPVDERFWTPSADKEGNARAIIRFLPAPEGETEDFAKFFTHFFEGKGTKKYIERCRTTLGEKDPAEEFARKVAANDKKLYGRFGRSPRYIANIIVIADPGKPENNGKNFVFEFGNKIMNKLTKAMEGVQDPIDPKESIKVLCPWEGANFKVVLCKKGGFNNYDDSEIMAKSSLFEGDDKKIEAVWKGEYPLRQFIAPTTFKSFEDLSKLLAEVVDVGDVDDAPESPRANPKAATATSARTTKAAPAAAVEAATPSEDPDKVFDDLLKGTEGVESQTADEAVDSMLFNDQ